MTDKKHDTLTIVLAVLCLMVIGGGGAFLASRAVAGYYPVEILPKILWLDWGCRITGKAVGFLLCGIIMGRFLKRVGSWHVLGWMTVYMVVVGTLPFLGFRSNYVKEVGVLGTVVQQVLQIATSVGLISCGIRLGLGMKSRLTAS